MANKISKKTVPSTPKKLSTEEQLKFRMSVKKELLRLNSIPNDTNQLVNEFLNKYASCEIVYKEILKKHHFARYNKEATELKVSMREAPDALSYLGYTFENNFLHKLFGSNKIINHRSCKKLRDKLIHERSASVVEELVNRQKELFSIMDTFLYTIEHFDDPQITNLNIA